MTDDAGRLNIRELCGLTDTPRRTVRFYTQIGLLDPPLGVRRGAYYTHDHLERLLAIRRWQRAGLSLDRIRELVGTPGGGADLPPEPPARPGHVTVRSHVLIAPGVELVIDPTAAGLTPEEVRALVRRAAALIAGETGEMKEREQTRQERMRGQGRASAPGGGSE